MVSFDAFADQLKSAGFAGAIESGPATTAVYGTDNSIYQTTPVGAVVPTSTADLATVARVNHARSTPFSLVARGGGTGTNGQSLTNGVVVDTRRAMNRIVSIDPAERRAVVQPGVVLAELNERLRPHGLLFAPHTSTASRCTVGGMVATDAAGKGSLVHGRTNRHVLAVDAVLADGMLCTFGNGDANAPERLLSDLARASAGVDAAAFPDVPRGFTGYNLVDAAGAGPHDIDGTKLLCGSEGTLALLGEITIRLTPLTSNPRLAVVSAPTFEAAIRESVRLRASRPTAIECLDEHTIGLASASPAWPTLADLLPRHDGALLLLEYDGDEGIERLRDLLTTDPYDAAVAVTSDPTTMAAVWKVRADAVGLLGRSVDGRRSVAFVEDCAVPPHRLEEFVIAFRALLDRHELSAGMFGHADVGCIHVRPALDLYDPAHEALVRTISDEAAELVGRFGGVLWGEHGRGFRGEYLGLPDRLVERMRSVKTAFDPRNILNPGKLYTPLGTAESVIAIDAVPLRVHTDRTVPATERTRFDDAFGCNGNGLCHHWGDAEMMCPSYKVTHDPRLSPKGRADLTRAWLASPGDAALADDLADSMRQCLSCGACTGRCPVEVDVPELKSRFLERHRDTDRRRRVRTTALSRFEALLPIVQRTAVVTGPMLRLASPVLRRAIGVVDLPVVPPGSLSARLDALGVPTAQPGDDLAGVTVVIMPDAFTGFLEPAVLEASIRVLRAVGERPAVGPFEPSGKLDHVTGRRDRFSAATARRRRLIERLRHPSIELVVIEPAIALMGAHECRSIDPGFPADAVRSIADLFATRLDRLPRGQRAGTAQLFAHCTESSLAPSTTETYRAMLEIVGYAVTVETTSCCGMAGVFGHEAEHQSMSKALFDRSWRTPLAADGPLHRCASGYSCRSQARRFGFEGLVHPVQVLAAGLDP